jgi:hypothetical protein
MKKFKLALALVAGLSAGQAIAETATHDHGAQGTVLEFKGVRYGNPFDSSTWWEGSTSMEPVKVNFIDPDFWMGFIRPDTHSRLHMTFTDPETYAAFFKAETYTVVMDLSVWAKWIDPNTYAALIDPQTYAYWMQPGAFMHVASAQNYAQLLDADKYATVFTAASDAFGVTEWVDAGSQLVASLTE